jgi:cholesterol transport system auxiliary component
MNAATPKHIGYRARHFGWLVLVGLGLLTGCGSILPKPPAQPALFVLDDTTATRGERPAKSSPAAAVSTLVVNDPSAAAGYGTRQIAYVRTANQLEYFAYSQWVAPPALMLAPLLARAIERTGAFAAVVRAPTTVAGDFRVETELIRLQQDFSVAPSRVRLTLRAVLIDIATRRVIASREFDDAAVSASEDPAGGVVAANQVAQRVATEVGAFCAQSVSSRN